mgnify:CR=1 FL=1
MLSSAPTYAEWVAVEKDYLLPGLQTVYIDPDTILREGNLVTVWELVDFKTMQGGRSPTRFFSTKTHKQFDCVGSAFDYSHSRSLQMVWEPGNRLVDM